MSKVLTIILIILLSILTIGLSIFLYFLLVNKSEFNWNFNFNSMSTNLIEEKEINTMKDLDIKTNITDIIIEEKTPEYHNADELQDAFETAQEYIKIWNEGNKND